MIAAGPTRWRSAPAGLLIGALVVTLALPPRALHAETAEAERARALFVQGKRHYAKGRYRRAIAAFEAAGEIRRSPLLDFNIGRCLDQLGEQRAAIARYRRYLAARPRAANQAWVRQRIAALARQVDPYEDLEPALRPAPGGAVGEGEPTSTPVGSAPASQPTSAPTSAPASQPVAGPTTRGGPLEAPSAPAEGGMALRHEAEMGGAWPARPSRRAAPPPRTYAPAPDRGPIYKEWWFWVGIAGAAVIAGFIIATVATKQSEGSGHSGAGLQIAF